MVQISFQELCIQQVEQILPYPIFEKKIIYCNYPGMRDFYAVFKHGTGEYRVAAVVMNRSRPISEGIINEAFARIRECL